MSTKRYIADWHYGHANVIGFDNRPFTSVEQMNDELIKRWNAVVESGDLTYILGDMFWCNPKIALDVLDKLNGTKILVKGNHDRTNSGDFLRRFAKVDEYIEIDDAGRKVILCHYPIPCFKNHFHGSYHLYGHVHNSFEWNMVENFKFQMKELYERPCNMFNVGVMMPWMNYTPQTLDDIIAGTERNSIR